ncbi:MarR family winged helix-turn-helix transcriptional regulator [Algihabitans albus]|uniref:MarR family winged helix-turn-helix transcriptional regulator n=1 Tax=Algihabitans albus TaxID=2164067 RepID=UPI000E5CFE5D|nr:MarR family transcriptional regulator [Algihabitans albus]
MRPAASVDLQAEETEDFRLAGFLPYRLSVTTNRVSRVFAARYTREFGISIPEWRVMAVLGERAPISSNEACDATAMDKAKVSRALATLLHRGFVKKAPHPDDQRLLRLSLTAKGRKVYAAIVPRARQLEAELMSGLTASERGQLDRLLDKLQARVVDLEG